MRTKSKQAAQPAPSLDSLNGPHSTAWLKADDIRIDPDCQRSLRPAWVRELDRTWDEDKLGVLYISDRGRGIYYAIDGQHRIMACRLRGEGDRRLECKIYSGLTKSDEARMFRGLNKRLNVRLFDDFQTSLTERDPEAVAINQIVEGNGLRVSDQATNGNVTAIKACQEVFRGTQFRSKEPTPWALARTLRTLTGAWQLNRDAVSGDLIRAVGAVHLRYGDAIDQDALMRKLTKFPGGPLGVVSRGKIKREMTRTTAWRAIAEVVVDIYNKGIRKDQLGTFARPS